MDDSIGINCCSVTYAQKSVRILSRYGINASYKKASKQQCGCGYITFVPKNQQYEAMEILRQVNIPIKPIL